jgi:hypothetical protein
MWEIKARGCADGRNQRETTTKEEASSPTVAIESAMLSTTINAMEERGVDTVDIPGAFMRADIDEVVHVRFEGEIAEMLVRMDPKYQKYVHRYVRQHPRATPGYMSRMFPPTTRVNVRQRLHQRLSGLM